jgi:hypothetical protein
MNGIPLTEACSKYVIRRFLEDTKKDESSLNHISCDDYVDALLEKLEKNEFHAYGNKCVEGKPAPDSRYEYIDKSFWHWFRRRFNMRDSYGYRSSSGGGVIFNDVHGYIGIAKDGRTIPHFYDDITIFEYPRAESPSDTPTPPPSNSGRTAATGWHLVAAKAAQIMLQSNGEIEKKEFLFLLSKFVEDCGLNAKFSRKNLDNLIIEINKMCK